MSDGADHIAVVIRRFLAAILILCSLMSGATLAQSPTPPSPGPVETGPVETGPAETAPAANGESPQAQLQLRQLLETLRDDDKRGELERQIEGLLAAQAQAQPSEPKPEELGLGARVLAAVSAGFNQFSQFVDRTGRAFGDSAHLWDWLERQGLNPRLRSIWLEILRDVAMTIGGGLLVAYGVRAALTTPRRRLAHRAEGSLFRRIRFSAARFVLDFLPVVLFTVVALGIAGWLQPPETARLVVLAFINASIVSMAALVIGRWLFSPMLPELRVLPMTDSTAVYLYIWTRRVILMLVWGYVLLQAALLLGMPPSGYEVAVRLLGLIIAALLVVLVLQNRQAVAHRIRGASAEPDAPKTGARPIVPGPVRARVAEVWHVAAVLYVVGVYLVWALNIADGFTYLMRASVITLIVIAVVGAGEVWAPRLFDRLSGIDEALTARYPFVADRANRYIPILRRALVYAVRIVAFLVILAAWQVDVAGVLFSDTGRDILSRLADIAIVVILSLAVWEVASGLITAHLNRRDPSGLAIIRSARVRTLLPLIRNALMIVISVMAALIVLSEIGVDIAPLLAGAGVVGLAIGFGAQSLVKDVITGAFFMIEGTINMGDVVTINGTGGLVEGMTVRSIRLRDYNGAVHTINFGSVGTVTNMTRDFSYFIFDTKIALRYDVDEVMEVLRQTGEEMRADDKFKRDILEPLEIAGVETFGDTTFIVRSRIKTRPIRQWDVGREFQRRLKRNLQARDIEMATPGLPAHVTVGSHDHGQVAAVAIAARRGKPDRPDNDT
ncbi:MAG TPA: mechanosensitive ion channel domain-containing protein [Dongiaceae bacterium]|nr:mechanosensitive ion channel domain-containing protein [Dongiaceae bacterium]